MIGFIAFPQFFSTILPMVSLQMIIILPGYKDASILKNLHDIAVFPYLRKLCPNRNTN